MPVSTATLKCAECGTTKAPFYVNYMAREFDRWRCVTKIEPRRVEHEYASARLGCGGATLYAIYDGYKLVAADGSVLFDGSVGELKNGRYNLARSEALYGPSTKPTSINWKAVSR